VYAFVAEYGVTPSKTMHGDLARLVGLILQAAGLLDDPSNSSTPQNIIRAALKDL